MEHSNRTGLQNSGTEAQLRQVLFHLHIQSLNEPDCQVCEEKLTEGDQITLYLYKPAGSARYAVGHCRCRIHDEDIQALFTLGVRELIIDGRIGRCRDPATQQISPDPLTPLIRLISTVNTTSGRRPVEHSDRPPHTGDQQSIRTRNGASPAQATGSEAATQPLNRMPVVVKGADSRETATLSQLEQASTDATEEDH